MAPLSNKQGYELARIGTERGLPVELQRLIWADVTKNYYLRGSVTERAATLLQAAWRRLGTTMSHWRRLRRFEAQAMPLRLAKYTGGGCNYGTKRRLGLSVYYMIGQGTSVIGQGIF